MLIKVLSILCMQDMFSLCAINVIKHRTIVDTACCWLDMASPNGHAKDVPTY